MVFILEGDSTMIRDFVMINKNFHSVSWKELIVTDSTFSATGN